MPYTALVSGRILCMHGGISKRMNNLNQLRNLQRPVLEVANPSVEIDILWSDPDSTVDDFVDSTRGVGQVFGAKALTAIMNKLDVDLVARAHQVVQDGYEFFNNKRLVTIFSAPHYCGEFDNAAAMMNVDKNLTCSFQVNFRKNEKSIKLFHFRSWDPPSMQKSELQVKKAKEFSIYACILFLWKYFE